MSIGQRILDARKQQALALRPVAAAAGISVVYLHDIEKGRRIPPIETVERIASALHLDVSCIAEQYHRERLQQSESGRQILQRIAAAEAALARALELADEWEDAYVDRAEGTGVWTIADEQLRTRLDAKWAEINATRAGADAEGLACD